VTRAGAMLSLACLGMACYAVYSIGAGLFDLLVGRHLEVLANLGLVALGLLLLLGAAFVRVLMPGGLALALGAMLGLQALALHNDAHWYGAIVLLPQVVRGVFAAVLALLALAGGAAARDPQTRA
jgi:hypothetical protein